MKKIKFHSIYYRYMAFICLLGITALYAALDTMGQNINLQIDGFKDFSLTKNGLLLIFIGFVAVILVFSFVHWKFYYCEKGIYIRKIDLLVPWNEIVAVSHVWITECNLGGKPYFYNRKTLVIYREDNKPICVYNVSLLALYIAKLRNPHLTTNMVSATLATAFNVTLNAWPLYEVYSKKLDTMQLGLFIAWVILYAIKVFVLPLLMTSHQNKLHGKFLFHDTALKKNVSPVIQV
ncbi:hypothetical protein [Atopobium fossor]|uniref:hypothetical protein n=1 Tax=Atopobium fossor TaxID=39487 RepID=UPI0004148244|nr:hypothetical protein [Atopobium fossor]